MPRALITGGYGYIGGHLIQSLLSNNWDVTILDTMFSSKPWDFARYLNKVYTINASVSNMDAASRAMYGVNVVYHLAARMDWDNNSKHTTRLFHTNAMGTVTVLAAAQHAGVDNVVFTSSAAVYGNVVGAEESGPKNPVNAYGCSKVAAEAACIAYSNVGMNVKILRLYNVWGGAYSGSVVSKFSSGHNLVYGDGTQTRDFVHIMDVVAALRMAAMWDAAAYNIGTGEEVTVAGLYSLINQSEPVYTEGPGYDEIQSSCADMTRTFNHTQWKPRTLLSELSGDEIRGLCK